ncbi:hypothetical protein [Cryobacterium sp. TMT2-17-1]|nr:hypothetical protein [Cryobacterium sp. TMT2-17-1]
MFDALLDTIFGLPVHPLVVHATAVVVPTAPSSSSRPSGPGFAGGRSSCR